MTQVEVLRDWGETAIGVAFWACLLWPAVTALFWPWWQNQWGWNMVIKTEMIALALLASVLRTEFGVASRYALLWVTVLAITAIPLVLAWRTALIWRSQRDGAERDRQLHCHFETGRPPGNRGPFRVSGVVNHPADQPEQGQRDREERGHRHPPDQSGELRHDG